MAKGKEKYEARQREIQLLGKDLARRAGRKCELCEESGTLRAFDNAPDDTPELEQLALLCERCSAMADGQKQDPRTLRFLETAIWSQVPAVAALAKASLAKVDEDWAREALSSL